MKMKTFVLVLFAVMMTTTVLTSSVMNKIYLKEETLFQSALPVEVTPTYDTSTNPGKLKAMLKGSIYESGEEMTVFGACFDGYGYLIAGDTNLTATFSSWYANGTQWELDQPMVMVGNYTGRYEYQVNMPTVPGTYLTEITCHYQGDIANAYGEWQNPNWVKRIKETQDAVTNLTTITTEYYNSLTGQILNFSNDVQANFSNVLNYLNSINSTSGTINQAQMSELYNVVKQIDLQFWAVDALAPYYSAGGPVSGGGMSSVDMVSPSDVFIVHPYDGVTMMTNAVWYWDGSSWSTLDVTAIDSDGATITDISVLPASTPYAWMSLQDGTGGYSINGGAPLSISGAASQDFSAIKVFQKDAASPIMAYAIEKTTGEVWYTNDGGSTWSNPLDFASGTCDPALASISQVVWYNDGVDNKYAVLMACGSGISDVIYYDGDNYTTYNPGGVSDAADTYLLTDKIGYFIDNANNDLYKFDNGVITKIYDTSTVELTSVVAASENDIWVGTASPGSFYHYDGINWEVSQFPYSSGVQITFGNSTYVIPAITDMALYDSRIGYAVSADGTVFKLYSNFNQKLDEISAAANNQTLALQTYTLLNITNNNVLNTYDLVNTTNNNVLILTNTVGDMYVLQNDTFNLLTENYLLTNITNNNILEVNASAADIKAFLVAMNLTIDNINTVVTDTLVVVNTINLTVTDIQNMVYEMNATLYADFTAIMNKLDDMNASISAQLTAITGNQTYMQLYLETTMYPMLNATYENTLQILVSLGIIEGKIDTNIELTNQTLIIANETKTGVDELVNKSRRIRAWITV